MYSADRNAPTVAEQPHDVARPLSLGDREDLVLREVPGERRDAGERRAPPIANQVAVNGIARRRPPICFMSVSSCRPCITEPADRNSSAL